MSTQDKSLKDRRELERVDIRYYVLAYVVIAAVFLAIGPMVLTSDRISSIDYYASIKIAGSLVAMIAGIGCLMYYFGSRNRNFLLIGLGFFVCGTEDLVHGILGWQGVIDDSSFIQSTYVAGRLTLGVMIIAATLLETRGRPTENTGREAAVFTLAAGLLGCGTALLAFSMSLPRFSNPEYMNYALAAVFAVGLVLVGKRFFLKRDIFSGMLVACIMFNLGGQIYMSFSEVIFDLPFDTAHWAAILGYCMPVLGVTLLSLQQTKASDLEARERRLAEGEVREREVRLQSLFQTMAEGVVLISGDGQIVQANPMAEQLLGLNRTGMGGYDSVHSGLEMVRSDGSLMPLDEMAGARAMREGHPVKGVEMGVRLPDESVRWMSASAAPLVDEGGHIESVVGTFADITDRREMEQALRRQQELTSTILAGTPNLMVLKDKDLVCQSANPAFCQFIGKEEKDIIGKTDFDLFPLAEAQHYHTEDIKVMETGIPENEDWEATGNRGLTWLHSTRTVVRDPHGVVQGILCTGEDISERKNMERDQLSLLKAWEEQGRILTETNLELQQALAEWKQAEEVAHESEAKYRALFQSMAEGFAYLEMIPDEHGNLVDCIFLEVNSSLERMAGLEAENIVGKRVTEILPGIQDSISDLIGAYGKRAATGEEIYFEQYSQLLDRWYSVSAYSPWAGRVVILFHDITSIKRAQHEREALLKSLSEANYRLEQSNAELQDFVYIASHDLREPLRKISAFGGMLHDSLEGKLDEDDDENLKFMIDGAGRMQLMIDDLLMYSRVSTTTRSLEAVDLNEVMGHLRQLELAVRIDETGANIDIPKPLPVVQADQSQVHQLLQNLVGNALKYRREGVVPEIIVRSTREDEKMVRVEVEDNGIGIEEENYDRVFRMFRRLQGAKNYEGSGIGLAVCKKIVERNGGSIGVRSVLGKGSTFWFTLPVTERAEVIQEKPRRRGSSRKR